MKKVSGLLFALCLFSSCRKDDLSLKEKECDIQKVYTDNAARVTITDGIWGTVSSMEGNCMPVINQLTCKHCPVKRTVKIYEYTLLSNATQFGNSGVFFDNFNTQLLAQADTDENGFFQITIAPGTYTIAVVENGKLYANSRDGQSGLNPVTLTSGKLNANVVMTYKAVF